MKMRKSKLKNRNFPKEFRKVVNYIESKKGFHVRLGSETKFLGHFSREIVIHHNYDLRHNGLYVLLYLIGKSRQPTTNIGINSYKKIDCVEEPEKYKLGEILQENHAWIEGSIIGHTLFENFNDKEYFSEKEKHLIKYL